jgi:hypothetical protein
MANVFLDPGLHNVVQSPSEYKATLSYQSSSPEMADTVPPARYTWSSLPPAGRPVEGTRIVPMKAPLAAEDCSWAANGGMEWGVGDMVRAVPGLTKVVSLVDLQRVGDGLGVGSNLGVLQPLFKGGPSLYQPEEVEAVGLRFTQLPVRPVGYASLGVARSASPIGDL